MLNRPGVDLHSPGIYENYFRQLYQAVNTDKHRINELRQRLDFPEVAARFKLIEDDSVPLVVRYPKDDSPVDKLIGRSGPWSPSGGRGPSPSQAVPTLSGQRAAPCFIPISAAGPDRELPLGLWEWMGNYHPTRGLVGGGIDPETLVI